MRHRIWITLTLGFISLGAMAQETLSFEDAARIALEQNVGLRQQRNNQFGARATLDQRFGAFTPSLSASVGGNVTSGLQFNNLTGEISTETNQNFGMSVDASYTVFNGFGRQNLYRQAVHTLAQQSQLTSRQEEQVLFSLASQYLQVLLDQELLHIAERNQAEQVDNLRVISAQVEAGIRPISDQYDTEALIKSLEISTLQARNTLANDEVQLVQTLQLEPGTKVTLQDPTWDMDALKGIELDLQALYNEAMASREDYKAQQSAIEASEAGLGLARSGYMPRLSLYASLSTGYTSQFIVADSTGEYIMPFNNQLRNNVQTQAGFSLNIPLYGQMSTKADVQRARVQQSNNQLTLENLERAVFSEVQQAVQNFQTAQQSLTAAQSQLVAAEKAFEIQKERFELGNTDLLTYNQSNTNLVRSRAELVQAEYRLMFQQLLLDYFVGRLDVSSFR